jgi:hypothetical protein
LVRCFRFALVDAVAVALAASVAVALAARSVLLSGISTMETNISTYVGMEHDAVSLVHWPGDAPPLLNVGVRDPLCADVDAALAQAKARVKEMLETAMEGPFALSAALDADVAMLALQPTTHAAEFFAQV